MQKLALALVSFIGFTLYTALVAVGHGPFGFIEIVVGGGWSTQVSVDLFTALIGFFVLAVPDAKRRGFSPWPYLPAMLLLGSIGLLAYFVHRELRGLSAGPRARADRSSAA